MPQHGCTTNAICYPSFSSMPAAASNANPADRPFNRDPLSLAKTPPVSKPTAGNRSALPLLHTLIKHSQVFPTSFPPTSEWCRMSHRSAGPALAWWKPSEGNFPVRQFQKGTTPADDLCHCKARVTCISASQHSLFHILHSLFHVSAFRSGT